MIKVCPKIGHIFKNTLWNRCTMILKISKWLQLVLCKTRDEKKIKRVFGACKSFYGLGFQSNYQPKIEKQDL